MIFLLVSKGTHSLNFTFYVVTMLNDFSFCLTECNITVPSAPSVVRSGDYYLFETDSEEEEEEEEKKDEEPPKKSAFQVT